MIMKTVPRFKEKEIVYNSFACGNSSRKTLGDIVYCNRALLTHFTGKIGFGALVRRIGEHCSGVVILYQFAKIHKH